MAGKADNGSSVSASACHIGGPIDVNHGELMLVYGIRLSYLLTYMGVFDLGKREQLAQMAFPIIASLCVPISTRY